MEARPTKSLASTKPSWLVSHVYVFVVVALAVSLVGLAISSQMPSTYTAVGRFQQYGATLIPGAFDAGLPLPPTSAEAVSEELTSRRLIQAAIERAAGAFHLTDGLARSEQASRIAQEARNHLHASAWHDALAGNVQFVVRFTDPDPHRAAALVDALAVEYRARRIDPPKRVVQEQYQATADALAAAETELHTAANAWRSALEAAVVAEEEAVESEEAANTAAGLARQIAICEQDIDQARSRRNTLLSTFTAQHPTVRDLDQRIADLETQRAHLDLRLQQIPHAEALETPVAQWATLKRNFEEAQAQRDHEAARERESSDLLHAVAGLNLVTLTAPAVPRSPDQAAPWYVVALSLVLGGVVAAIAAKAAVLGQATMWTARQVESWLEVPVVGVVSVSSLSSSYAATLPARRLSLLIRTVSEALLLALLVWIGFLAITETGFLQRFLEQPWHGFREAVQLGRRLLG